MDLKIKFGRQLYKCNLYIYYVYGYSAYSVVISDCESFLDK